MSAQRRQLSEPSGSSAAAPSAKSSSGRWRALLTSEG